MLFVFSGSFRPSYARHCEELSDAAIPFFRRLRTAGLLRFARKDMSAGPYDFINLQY